jgi:hypothetical protein
LGSGWLRHGLNKNCLPNIPNNNNIRN